MELVLEILLGMVSLICLAGGTNLMLKGASSFLPKDTPSQPVLNNLFRFLSGIYFSLGFLVAWATYNLHQINQLVYLIGLVVVCSGLGRLYSRMKVGSAGTYFDFIMIVEIVLGMSMIVLEYLR